MRRLEIPAGTRFGRLTVVGEAEPALLPCGQRARVMECDCDCGSQVEVRLPDLRSSRTGSCGCLHSELLSVQNAALKTTHGQAGGKGPTSNYKLWSGIKARTVTGTMAPERYLGRGIGMYKPWINDFLAFDCWMKENLGPRPDDCSLDRINNDGNYEPGNLRWATRIEQANNTRTNVHVTFSGETMTLVQWAEKCGMSLQALRHRIFKAGWPLEKALTTPVRRRTHAN